MPDIPLTCVYGRTQVYIVYFINVGGRSVPGYLIDWLERLQLFSLFKQ